MDTLKSASQNGFRPQISLLPIFESMRYPSYTKSCNATSTACGNHICPAKILKIMLVFLTVQLGLAGGWAEAVSASVQTQVIEEALGGQFCQDNLKVIVWGCDSGSEDAADSGPSYKHFLDADLLKSINYMEREKLKILNLCITADSDQASRALALYHMGLLIHTAQEFYARSNYLELKLADYEKAKHVPTSEELYGLELVDWNALTTLLRNGSKSNLQITAVEKGNPDSAESQKKVAGVSYFAVARELSLRETERQWHQLSSLIKSRLTKNGTEVLVALQNAGVPEQAIADLKREQDGLLK